MQDSRFDINKIKKTYKDMRNYFNDIKELSKSEIETTHAQFVVDMLLKWESTQFKAKQRIPITFNEYLILSILLPNEANKNDPSIVDGLWAYQYFLINIGEKKEADTLDSIMRNKIGKEAWNELKKRNVIAANLLRSEYEKTKTTDHSDLIEDENKAPNQLDFDFIKEDKEEKQIPHQQVAPETEENPKEDKFDMIRYLDRERKQKIVNSYAWTLALVLLACIVSYTFYGLRFGRLDETVLGIMAGALIIILLGFTVVRWSMKKTRRGKANP